MVPRVLLVVLILAAGCQPRRPAPPVVTRAPEPRGESWAFSCPVPGTRVETLTASPGPRRLLRKAGQRDPLDLTRCAVRIDDGPEEWRLAYGAWPVGGPQAAAMDALLPAAPGDCAASPDGALQPTVRGASFQRNTLCFRGFETLDVGGEARRVAVIADRVEGVLGEVLEGERILLFDVRTRALLASEFRLVRGTLGDFHDWRATRLSCCQ